MLKKITLDNGLRLLFFSMASTKAVTVLFLAKTGSKHETKRINGISHLLEHLLFRGTKKWPQSNAISQALDRVGGLYNAFTGKESLQVFAKVGSENLALASEIISEMVSQPLLKEKDIIKEKGIIVEEINMYEDTPRLAVFDLWEELLYGDQPAGWPIAGSKKSVGSISRIDLRKHLDGHFVGQNCVLVFAGNFLPRTVLKTAEKFFRHFPVQKPLGKLPVKERQASPGFLSRQKKTDQTHLCLGVRAFDLFSPQQPVLEVLASLLGGMMSSRLFIEIREKRSLAYYLQTALEAYSDSGYLVTAAGINNNKVEEAVKVICREYKKIREERVNQKELEKAKENLRGRLRLGLETSDQFAHFLGEQELLKDKIQTPEQKWQEIAKVTPGDILKVARQIFRPERLNLALIGPQPSQELLKSLKL